MKFLCKNEAETQKIAEMLTNNIFWFSNILFFWEMWAGKTFFIKNFLKKLWVENLVKSPSFWLSNHYKWKYNFQHFDLYRLENDKKFWEIYESFFWEDFVLCEWAEKLSRKPENRIEIFIKKLWESRREIEILFFWQSLLDKDLAKLYKKYKTPKNVLNHISKVWKVATKVAENLLKKWVLVNLELVKSWAFLHDLVRYIDFKHFDKKNFPYKVSDKDFDFYKEMRQKHKWKHHADLAFEILDSMGKREIWEVIIDHKTEIIFEWFQNLEGKIVHYADRRVVHDKITSLKERIEDAKKRYWKIWDEKFWEEILEKSLDLEKELWWNLTKF